MNKIDISTDTIYAVGDIHGDFESIKYNINRNSITDSLIIFCGDCGFGFNKKEYYLKILKQLNKYLNNINVHIIFFRGNHDDPDYFNDETVNYSNIKAVSDYTVLHCIGSTIEYNILCVGGGISIDRISRIKDNLKNINKAKKYHINEENVKKCYWDGEAPFFSQEKIDELTENNIKIQSVCTHSCPKFMFPYVKNGLKEMLEIDEKLNEDTDNEREVISKIYFSLKKNKHKIEKWIYGHFHCHNMTMYEDTKFILLDMSRNNLFSFYEIKRLDI